MLRIGPIFWIHTSRTGASSFSAIFRGSDPAPPCLDRQKVPVLRHFSRQRTGDTAETRSEERRVRKEGVSTFRLRWWPFHSKTRHHHLCRSSYTHLINTTV